MKISKLNLITIIDIVAVISLTIAMTTTAFAQENSCGNMTKDNRDDMKTVNNTSMTNNGNNLSKIYPNIATL